MDKNQVITRRLLLSMGTLAGMGAFTLMGRFKHLNDQFLAIGDEKRDFTVAGATSLRDRAVSKGLIYGAAGNSSRIASNKEYAIRFAQECGILVPEWELKWKPLRPSLNSFDFSRSDWLVKFAHEHKILFRGHTLVWHRDLPSWFQNTVNKQNAEQILLKHITTVAKHYAGKIHSWDVVNEAVRPSDGQADGLRNTPWLRLLGSDYIEIAFRSAAEADPQALLVYNDFQLEYDTRDEEAKRTAVLKLLERLKSREVPVHALGIQAHLHGDGIHTFNPKKLKAFLSDVAGMGLKILITEMDVSDQKLPKSINLRDRIVAGSYEDFLSVALDEPAVIAVLTWGLSDRYTWLSKDKPRKDRAPVRPLPLDAQLNRKLAWNAIARAFDNAPKR